MKRLTSQDRIIFTLDGFHNRTRRDWARAKQHAMSTPEGMAKSHARKHGKAGIWNANDSLTLFYQVPGGLRQTTFPRAVPTSIAYPA